jgi:hypothetical protein
MNEIEDNYLQKFYKRNTNLSEITTNKNIIYKSLLRFIELGEKEVFFLWITSNILIYNILF